MDERVRIDSLTIRELRLPFRTPFHVSTGVLEMRRSLIVEIREGDVTGYGESAPCEEPFYSAETVGTVRTIYEELYLPRLAGREFASIRDFDAELRRGVRGNHFARAGLENAYWDVCCRRGGISLPEAIARQMTRLELPAEHLRPRERVPSGVAVGIPPDEKTSTLEEWIGGYLEEGYRRVKIKTRPGWDVEACRAARRAAGDDFPLWTDANSSFDLDEHLDVFRRMDDLGLLFHEQPLHHRDLLDHSRLAREIRTPLCLDESLISARSGRQALALESSRIWNIKVQRVGGLTEALEIYRLAAREGVELWGGTMPESGLGAQAILALAAFPQFVYPTDVEASTRWYEPGQDPVEVSMSADGWIATPTARGIEEVLDRERYERFTTVTARAGPPGA